MSTPSSEFYREFASAEDIASLVAPSPRTVAGVHQWLNKNGVSDEQIELNPSGDFLLARAVSPRIIESAFGCQLRSFSSASTKRIAQVCEKGFSIPPQIAPLVDFVGGLDYFPSKLLPPTG